MPDARRLGKTAESDAELQGLVDRGDLALSLTVAEVYRGIGSAQRATTIATDVFARAAAPLKSAAAVMLGMLAASDDERARWFGEADPDDPFVRTELLMLEGRGAMLKGNHAECDRAFAKAAAAYLANNTSGGSAGFNNAALAHQRRFYCNGKLGALADAEAALERAYRLDPEQPLVVGNLAAVLATNAELRTLARRIDLGALQLGDDDAGMILDSLLRGTERDAILAELDADPGARRSVELTAQEEVLAPNRTDAHQRRFDGAHRRRDEAAMAAALTSLRAATNLDTSAAALSYAGWIDGSMDADMLERSEAAVVRAAAVTARSDLDPRTRAAAHVVAGAAHYLRARLEGDAAVMVEARTALLAAAELWPALEVAGSIAYVFIDEAGIRADAVRWVKERRIRSAPAILTKLAADGDPLVTAVRASAEWAQVLTFIAADPTPPTLDDWRLAQLLGDAALIERTRAVPADPIARMTVEAEAILHPGRETTAEDRALLSPPPPR